MRGAANSAQSCSASALIALWCSLALRLDVAMSWSRSSGSSMSVPSRVNSAETLLAPERFDSERTETGTVASSELSGSSSRSSR